MPLVSIGLPVYNAAGLLPTALESLLAQDYPNFELVISDNASTDETGAICREHAQRDSRISYHRADVNRGASWNFNRVFELSRGEYFMWGAHDDLWDPRYVSSCVEVLRSRPEAVLCHSVGQPISQRGEPIGEPYRGIQAEAPHVRERWRQVISRWDMNEAIYGVMRREAASRTRMVQSCLCADLIFVAELALHGAVTQVPETLSWKRRPESMADYRSYEEMLVYLAGRSLERPRLLRLSVLRECLAGLRSAELPASLRRQLVLDTYRTYLSRSFWLTDVKEWAVQRVGRQGYRRWASLKSSLRGKAATP